MHAPESRDAEAGYPGAAGNTKDKPVAARENVSVPSEDSSLETSVGSEGREIAPDLNSAASSPSDACVSIWKKAKRSLGSASTRVSLASSELATKSRELGGTGVEKLGAIGKHAYRAAGDTALQTLQSGKHAYSGSKLESTVKQIDGVLDQSGTKQACKDAAQAVVDKLDELSGKRLLELVEEKLQLQDLYNNVLATRLAEALERIAALEVQLRQLGANGVLPLSDAGDCP